MYIISDNCMNKHLKPKYCSFSTNKWPLVDLLAFNMYGLRQKFCIDPDTGIFGDLAFSGQDHTPWSRSSLTGLAYRRLRLEQALSSKPVMYSSVSFIVCWVLPTSYSSAKRWQVVIRNNFDFVSKREIFTSNFGHNGASTRQVEITCIRQISGDFCLQTIHAADWREC